MKRCGNAAIGCAWKLHEYYVFVCLRVYYSAFSCSEFTALNASVMSANSTKSVEQVEANDPDIISQVLSAAEAETQPMVDRLRRWGQENKEPLIRVLCPLWFVAVLLVVMHPTTSGLLLFTTFSVCVGSLFAPFEEVIVPGKEKRA